MLIELNLTDCVEFSNFVLKIDENSHRPDQISNMGRQWVDV